MAAASVLALPAVPGLTSAPSIHDLEESTKIYNSLPDDSEQPHIAEKDLSSLGRILEQYHVQDKFGLHLIHGHFKVPLGEVMFGRNIEWAPGCWTKPTSFEDLDAENIHGHIFKLCGEQHFTAYEYRDGPRLDLTGIDKAFFHDFTQYLVSRKLQDVVGLQVLTESGPKKMAEIVIRDAGTVMLDADSLLKGRAYRETGWACEDNAGTTSLTAGESHIFDFSTGTHWVYNAGAPLRTDEDLRMFLVEHGWVNVNDVTAKDTKA